MGGLGGGGGGYQLRKPQEPPPMPDEQSPDVLEAKRRKQAEALARGGRQSTILTAPEGRGGAGDTYTKTALG